MFFTRYRTLLPCTLMLIFSTAKAQSILPVNLGEGSLQVKMYIVPKSDSLRFDAHGKLYEHYVYYVKKNKVFRKESIEAPITSVVHNGGNSTELTINRSRPACVFDVIRKLAYTFDLQYLKRYVTIDSLKDKGDEIFYRTMFTEKNAHIKITGVKLHPLIMQVIRNGTDTCYFKYAKEKLPMVSPLAIFAPAFKYPIVAVNFSLKNAKGQNSGSRMIIAISEVKGQPLQDSLFTFSSTAIIQDHTRSK
ncbi:hypothetical protein SAMN04488505_10225 [Chitinophaga rupis]|uniref:GLPGLI family protein n=1 Tax=Chitinophaga rupis TaxID=573321 RepID=A0A1H7P8H9_9BACT|nr:hypothetical protein [Chitinophaga rupis]SEL32063.1 hypothetical protein SAMN04488505_10225 [Chitinophaga rupis]